MKIAVVGHKGFVGSELINKGCVPLDCDVTGQSSVHFEIEQVKPDVIIYASAKDDVEWCELHQKEAYQVNTQGVANIFDYFDGTFIYLSSVHVFAGKKFWDYKEDHKPAPVNMFGFTKWGGELATDVSSFMCEKTMIVRTSKLFNYSSIREDYRKFYAGKRIEKPGNIKRSFLYLPHFVDSLMYCIKNIDDMPDLLNIAGTDTMSYFKFWKLIADIKKCDTNLVCRKDKRDVNVPVRGGLSMSLAGNIGVPVYSAFEGIKEMLV